MVSQTLNFFRYLIGARKAYTSDTDDELQLLGELASGSMMSAEIGVFEGVASERMARCLPSGGRLLLVDPFFHGVKLERLLHFSMARSIAYRQIRRYINKIIFIRLTSIEAARAAADLAPFDFIFIDARHDYDSVLADFRAWGAMLSAHGVIAFHDSSLCAGRPELNPTVGPVRLVNEIEHGDHGTWRKLRVVDSISVVGRLSGPELA